MTRGNCKEFVKKRESHKSEEKTGSHYLLKQRENRKNLQSVSVVKKTSY